MVWEEIPPYELESKGGFPPENIVQCIHIIFDPSQILTSQEWFSYFLWFLFLQRKNGKSVKWEVIPSETYQY